MQKSNKSEGTAVMKQNFSKTLKVRSQSPFIFEWEAKSADPYLQNLKLRSEKLQNAPLVAPSDEEFWFNCTLTSQSVAKPVYLTKANLEILERSKLKLLEKVDLGGASEKNSGHLYDFFTMQ